MIIKLLSTYRPYSVDNIVPSYYNEINRRSDGVWERGVREADVSNLFMVVSAVIVASYLFRLWTRVDDAFSRVV